MSDGQVPIGKIVISDTQTSISFTNLPQGYRDLRLEVSSVCSSSSSEAYSYLYFNSDTAANYLRVEMYGTGNNAAAASAPSSNLIPITMPISTATSKGIAKIDIMDYSVTDKYKPVVYHNSAPNSTILIGAGRWNSLAAINSITLTAYTYSFGAGSIFTLWGVLA